MPASSNLTSLLMVALSLCLFVVGAVAETVHEFPLAMYGPMTSRSQGYIAATIAFDIDFRKNFDPSLRERFGEPIVKIEPLHPDLRIQLHIGNSNSEVLLGMQTVLDWFLASGNFSRIIGLIGGQYSSVAAPISNVAAVFKIPFVSWGATNPDMSDKSRHPYFLRTSPPDSLVATGMWAFLDHFGVPAATFVYTNDDWASNLFLFFSDLAGTNPGSSAQVLGINFALGENGAFDETAARDICRRIRASGSKVIIMLMVSVSFDMSFLYVMEQEGMLYGLGSYQLLAGWSTLYLPDNPLKPSRGFPVGFMWLEAENRGQLFPKFVDMWKLMRADDIYGDAARQLYKLDEMRVSVEEGSLPMLTDADFSEADAASMEYYFPALFDSGYAYIIAINSLLNKGVVASEIHGEVLLEELKHTQFEGASGNVAFNQNGDRNADYKLVNLQPVASPSVSGLEQFGNESIESVRAAVFSAITGQFEIVTGSGLFWAGGLYSDQLPEIFLSCNEGFEFDDALGYCTPCPNGWFSLGGFKAQCQACSPGFTSSLPSASPECHPCLNGTFRSAIADESCIACPAGTFAASEGQSACALCPVGTYAEGSGNLQCRRCGDGRESVSLWSSLQELQFNGVTEYVHAEGSTSQSACGCDKGSRPRDDGEECIRCTEGLICGGMNSTSIQAGYFSGTDLSVYKCFGESERCTGGLPGQTCAKGRVGLVCAECEDGMTPGSNGACKACKEANAALLIASVATMVFLGLVLLYAFMDNRDTATQNYAVLIVVIALGQLITAFQQLSVVGELPADWVNPMKQILKQFGLLSFNIEVLRLPCVGAVDVVAQYFLKVSIIFITLAGMIFIHLAFVLVRHGGQFKERRPSLIGSVGVLFMLFYISVTSTVLEPFQCQKHPNEVWTIVSYPGVVCWWSDDHTVMLIVAVVVLLAVPVAYMATCTFVVMQLPKKISSADTDFLRAFSFLFFRFNTGKAHYAIWQVVRNFGFAAVLAIPEVAWQALSLELILVLSLVILLKLEPWRVAAGNSFDCLIHVSLLIVMYVTAFYINNDEVDLMALSRFCVFMVAAAFLPVSLAMLHGCYVKLRHVKPYEFFLCHHKACAGAFARLLKMCIKDSRKLRSDVFLDSDNLHNLGDLFNYVGNDTEKLTVIGTSMIFTRPWCVGEMCTARLKKVEVVVLAMSSFTAPAEEDTEDIEQIEILIEQGMTLPILKETLNWVANLPQIDVPELLSAKVLASLVDVLFSTAPLQGPNASSMNASLASSRSRGMSSSAGHLTLRPHEDHASSTSMLIFDLANPEACASSLVLQKMLSRHLATDPSKIPVLMEEGVLLLLHHVEVGLFICTAGCLDKVSYSSVLLQLANIAFDRAAVVVALPVIAEATFQIPSRKQLSHWELVPPGGLPREEGPKLAQAVNLLFREIALQFQPHHEEEHTLEVRAMAVLHRLTVGISASRNAHTQQGGDLASEAASEAPSHDEPNKANGSATQLGPLAIIDV